MKVIVNSGRTVRVAVKGGIAPKKDKETGVRPVVKVYGPTRAIDLPDDEAKFLIERGFVREDKPIEVEKDPEGSKDGESAEA